MPRIKTTYLLLLAFVCFPEITFSQCCCERLDDVEVPGGDFEFSPSPSPGGWIDYTSGQSVGPWEVSSGSISHHDDGHNNLGNGNPNSSNAHLDLNGFSQGGVCQDISGFVVGQQYELVFYYSIHNGITSGSALVEIEGGSVLDEDWSASNQGQNNWLEATYTFTATDETMELCFSSEGGIPCCGMLIDDIEILAICIEDTEDPELMDIPDDAEYPCLDDVPTPAMVIGSDNCISDIQVEYDDDIDDDDPCEIIIERIWLAEDDCGNEEEHTQYITIIDKEGPVFDKPLSDLEVGCDQDYQRLFNEWIDDFGEAEFEEHCGEEDEIKLEVLHEILDSAICSEIEVTFTFTDACENETIDYAFFRIIDNTSPVFVTPPSTLNIPCGGDRQLLIDEWLDQDGFSVATDNCSQDITNDFSGDYNSSQVVNFITTDRCGTSASLQAEIVIDMNLQVVEIDTFTCDPAKEGIEETLIDNIFCDSLLRYSYRLLARDTTILEFMTCDINAVGYDTINYSNLNGCDSMVISFTDFAQSDTLYNSISTCELSQVGLDTLFLSNINNCDSLVITNAVYREPDTTYQYESVCQATEIGLDTLYLINSISCDSIIIIEKTYVDPSPIVEDLTTCDPSKVGVDTLILFTQNDCDSIVIRRIEFSEIDTLFSDLPTCEITDLGSDTLNLTSIDNCDSIVVNNFFLVQNDTILITEYSCDIDQPLFSDTTIPGPVCDTVQRIEMLPLLSDTTLLQSSTCKLSEVGSFTTSLMNVDGCDSTIISSIIYEPIDTIFFNSETCFLSELVQDTVNISSGDCDSVYVFSTILLQGNQTEIIDISCEENDIGFDTLQLQNIDGCDSLIITETYFYPILFDWSIQYDPCEDDARGIIEIENLSTTELSYALNSNIYSSQDIYSDLPSGLHTLYVQDENGCEVGPVDIFFEPSQEINLDLPLELILINGSSQQIFLEFSEQPTRFYWSDEELVSCTDCLDPIIASQEEVELTIFYENSLGCLYSRSLMIKIEEQTTSVYIPNVLSLEEGTLNNYFKIFSSDPSTQVEICEIYDRWGNKVYNSGLSKVEDLEWDGTYNKAKVLPGVYVYRIVLIDSSEEKTIFAGDLTVLR